MNQDEKRLAEKRAACNERASKFYDTHIATDKVSVFCEYCQATHEALRLTYDKNIARNGKYICEREGGHIAGSRPKPHLKKINPYEAEGKKECNTCRSVLPLDSFSSGKSICKACRAARYKDKYASKRVDRT